MTRMPFGKHTGVELEKVPRQYLLWLRRQPQLGAWLAKESVRDIHLTERVGEARTLLRKAIVGCQGDEVAEIRTLGHTLERWSEEILNHHRTGASNRTHRGHEPVRDEDQARWSWVLLLRALPPARPPPQPEVSPGPGVPHRLGSEAALPASTCRAALDGCYIARNRK